MPNDPERFVVIPEDDFKAIYGVLQGALNMFDILLNESTANVPILQNLVSLLSAVLKSTDPEKLGPGVSFSELLDGRPGGRGPADDGLDITPLGNNTYVMRMGEQLAKAIEANSEDIEYALDDTVEKIKHSINKHEAEEYELKFTMYLSDLLHLNFIRQRT